MNLSIKAKIAAGITAAAVIGIGVIVGVTAINNNHDIPAESSYVSESETEDELYHDGSSLGEGLYLPKNSENSDSDEKEESVILTGYQNTFSSRTALLRNITDTCCITQAMEELWISLMMLRHRSW